MSPFLKTKNFSTVLSGIGNRQVEGILWKDAVPKPVMHAIKNFNFDRIVGRRGKGYSSGRDLWKKETVAFTKISEDYPELLIVDNHIRNIQKLFRNNTLCTIPKSRGSAEACHFITTSPLTLENQTPHIDSPSDKKTYGGKLGIEWRKSATPDNYPSYKVLSTLSDDSDVGTILVPHKDRGEENPSYKGSFPNADTAQAEHAEPGDIVILKQCITLHYGPQGIERRWVTVY